MPGVKLPEHVELLRTRVMVERDRVYSVCQKITTPISE